MRRAVVTWLVVLTLAIGSGTVAVLTLNATTFGAASFVRVYLEAIGRGDVAGALALPGVTVDEGTRTDFLTGDALPGLGDLREISVEAGDEGTSVVTFSWRSARGDGTSSFVVERIGSRFGLFPDWAFAVSPLTILRLTVEHDQRFAVNGIPAVSGVAAPTAVDYALLAPGIYLVDHHSTYLRAAAVEVAATRPGSVVGATLDVQPSRGFVEAVAAEVHASLEACATQEVLFPTGCPFGRAIANRVVSAPEWSIVEPPAVTLTPSADFGVWLVPATPMTTHLRVDVQSLFDGSISTYDEDVPVTVSYLVTILADDETLRVVLVT